MKKSTKLISALLAVLMIVTLMPAMALADQDAAPAGGSIVSGLVDTVNSLEVPTYVVYCKLSNGLPAVNAEITLTNELTGETQAYQSNLLGIVLIPKSLIGVYSVAATCDGPLTGIKYSTVVGLKWSASILLDVDRLVLYPMLNIGLNYTDHFSYMIGYNDGTVRPNGLITRGEAASMIFRLLTPQARNKFFTTENNFKDVSNDNAHKNAIATLVKAGILKGYSDTYFGWKEPITREQFSAIIGRMFSVEYVGTNMFADLTGGFADGYINLLAMLGIMKGDKNGNAHPAENISRAEAATMLNRLLGRLPASDSSATIDDIKAWPDCPADMWCYGDIMEATYSHNYTWAEDLGNILNDDTTCCEEWTSLRTDTPNWADLQK